MTARSKTSPVMDTCTVAALTVICLMAIGSAKTVTSLYTSLSLARSQSLGSFDDIAAEKQENSSLGVLTNCSDSYVKIETLTNEDGSILLSFSVLHYYKPLYLTSQECTVHLTSQTPNVISVVLLEHSLCGGGVFLLLWDRARRKRWDVCSVWHAPGPDFVTSLNVVDVNVERVYVTDPCNFSVSVRAVEKLPTAETQTRYLSATEGRNI